MLSGGGCVGPAVIASVVGPGVVGASVVVTYMYII